MADFVPPGEGIATTRLTALDFARQRWEQDGWGEPRDERQERLWSLFWTRCEPTAPIAEARGRAWTRPDLWVEKLVRA